jgi:diguanylate cyclase (GGDEF)-like protein
MIDLRREIGADRRREFAPGDDWKALRRFSALVWFAVALGAFSVLAARHALEPGSTERLVWSGLFGTGAAAITSVLPRRFLLAGDLLLRGVGIWVLYLNVERNLTPDHWLLCLPMFLTSILIPALFYRAIPMTLTIGAVSVATARLAFGADAAMAVRAVGWGSFVWIAVMIVVVIQRLVGERRRALDAMAALAATDTLTGLPNRRHFMEGAARMLRTGHEEGRPCTLILFDVDHFKSVNDVYGHDAGDRVLVGVADAMRSACRTDDLVARLGGEEFAILMLGASGLHAQYVAAELAATLRSVEPVAVTASYGAIEAKLGELDIGDLLVRADAVLYQAKRAGRNRCVVET